MFKGEYRHSIDAKGRIAVPAKFRAELGENIVINRYLDNCLALYSEEGWQKEYEKLMKLNTYKADERRYLRARISQTFDLTYDGQGRILVPQSLIQLASLVKDCVFIGTGDHVELWSKENWEPYLESLTDEEISSISENIPWNM